LTWAYLCERLRDFYFVWFEFGFWAIFSIFFFIFIDSSLI
jgi:hypothetical protein